MALGREGHPSRCLTVVHDGGDRVDTVTLWLAAPRAAHLGDQVGWPRGGLAPSATYSVRLGVGSFLSVLNGTLVAWQDVPGPGPLLTPAGELYEQTITVNAPNVVPLRRFPGSGPSDGLGSRTGAGGAAVTCPCRAPGRLRLAGRQDEQRERERSRREQASADAVAVAEELLLSAVLPDGAPDVEALVAGLREVLAGEVAVGPLAQRIAAGVPAVVMAAILRRLPEVRAGNEQAGEQDDEQDDEQDGEQAGEQAGEQDDDSEVGFRVAYRVLAQRSLAVHGEPVLDALPARLVADGMAAQALVRPRLERLLGRPLPGELARQARWSLHGLDEAFGDMVPFRWRSP